MLPVTFVLGKREQQSARDGKVGFLLFETVLYCGAFTGIEFTIAQVSPKLMFILLPQCPGEPGLQTCNMRSSMASVSETRSC